MLALAIVGIGSLQAAEIPDDVRAEFPRAEKENQVGWRFFKAAKGSRSALHAHDVGRTAPIRRLPLLPSRKNCTLKSTLATMRCRRRVSRREKKPPEVGRIGTINLGKIKIER